MHRRFDESDISSQLKDPPGIYRFAKIGRALRDTVADLKSQNKISTFLEAHILETFDLKMAQRLQRIGENEQLFKKGPRKANPPLQFKVGKVSDYKVTDGCWQIGLENVVIDLQSQVAHKKVTVLADNFGDRSFERKKLIKALIRNPTYKK